VAYSVSRIELNTYTYSSPSDPSSSLLSKIRKLPNDLRVWTKLTLGIRSVLIHVCINLIFPVRMLQVTGLGDAANTRDNNCGPLVVFSSLGVPFFNTMTAKTAMVYFLFTLAVFVWAPILLLNLAYCAAVFGYKTKAKPRLGLNAWMLSPTAKWLDGIGLRGWLFCLPWKVEERHKFL
jgi:hypothetical protein